MKKVLLIIILLGVAGFVAILCANSKPIEERLSQANTDLKEGRYAEALPVFKKAVKKFSAVPASKADALYKQALCETALGKSSEDTWKAVQASHESAEVKARADFELIAFSADKEAAKKAYVAKYPTSIESQKFLTQDLKDANARGDSETAEKLRRKMIENFPESPEAKQAEEYIGEKNLTELREGKAPYITNHVVRSGEILNVIARKFKTTSDSIVFINRMNTDRIRINQRLRIDMSEYLLDVSISEFKMRVYRVFDGQTNFFKSYLVGTGKNDNTPRGDFIINLKQKEPTWYKDNSKPIPYGDPENALGTRWMAITSPGFGIHGTWEPDSVGKASSAGCVRLRNEDVEELYAIVKEGTKVHIHD